MSMQLIEPQVIPPMDESFRPAVLANRNFQRAVQPVGERVVIGLERSGGDVSRFELAIYPEDHADFDSNYQYVERIVKFLLWQRGGHTLYVGGSPKIAEYLKKTYNSDGAQKFDYHFMGEQVYEKEFSVVSCDADEVPASRETGKLLGRNLQGHRIGFDLGASDRKVSAVVDGDTHFQRGSDLGAAQNSDPNITIVRS
jgi:hypothetical protein